MAADMRKPNAADPATAAGERLRTSGLFWSIEVPLGAIREAEVQEVSFLGDHTYLCLRLDDRRSARVTFLTRVNQRMQQRFVRGSWDLVLLDERLPDRAERVLADIRAR